MNFSEHCFLCDNIKTSLDKGITCILTNTKPNFKITCSKIKLNKKLQDKLEKVNLEVELILQNQKSVLIKFYIFIIIGLILTFGGFFFIKKVHFSLYTLWFTYLSIGGGISIISASYFLLNNFRKKIRIAKFEKNKLDELLNLYDIEYNIDISFSEKKHGNQEAKIELKLDNRRNKKSSRLYNITDFI